MHDEEKPGESYARKVVEGTKRFAQDLIGQNDRLSKLACEEIAIFEFDPGESELCLTAYFGIDQARYERIPLGSGFIGRKAELGESYFRE